MSRRRFTAKHSSRPNLYIPKWISTIDLLPQMNLVSARHVHCLRLCTLFTPQLPLTWGTDHGDHTRRPRSPFPYPASPLKEAVSMT